MGTRGRRLGAVDVSEGFERQPERVDGLEGGGEEQAEDQDQGGVAEGGGEADVGDVEERVRRR
ncbi:hypothetical protein OHA10_14760 [Kribbella sp. NBC_00662]|uniref:hypothetical protein n=1 Tax=Kribbella sp. NBC_00662 TaxID=2975969 RepID=UPI00324EE26C